MSRSFRRSAFIAAPGSPSSTPAKRRSPTSRPASSTPSSARKPGAGGRRSCTLRQTNETRLASPVTSKASSPRRRKCGSRRISTTFAARSLGLAPGKTVSSRRRWPQASAVAARSSRSAIAVFPRTDTRSSPAASGRSSSPGRARAFPSHYDELMQALPDALSAAGYDTTGYQIVLCAPNFAYDRAQLDQVRNICEEGGVTLVSGRDAANQVNDTLENLRFTPPPQERSSAPGWADAWDTSPPTGPLPSTRADTPGYGAGSGWDADEDLNLGGRNAWRDDDELTTGPPERSERSERSRPVRSPSTSAREGGGRDRRDLFDADLDAEGVISGPPAGAIAMTLRSPRSRRSCARRTTRAASSARPDIGISSSVRLELPACSSSWASTGSP